MKAIILAGGLGTRISEETTDKPKPMVTIAGRPIIWHIMSILAKQGIFEFIVAAGYKVEVIENWSHQVQEPWKIQVLDTGLETQTGGRIKKCMEIIPNERVLATYGDGLGNIYVPSLIDFHVRQGKLATVTAVHPPARFGVLEAKNGLVTKFGEKNQTDSGWINGGFFILEPEVVHYVHSSLEPFETGAIPRLVAKKNLTAFHHSGFWHPMDTLREKLELEKLALVQPPPWLKNL